MLEQESFWDSESFVIVTDGTKPAMKLTIEELAARGKRVHVIDESDKPERGMLRSISELPADVEAAVIGLTRTNPADAIDALGKKGIRKFWIHWRTETPEAVAKCNELRAQCTIGRCPMMYLGRGLNVHALHRSVARLFGKY